MPFPPNGIFHVCMAMLLEAMGMSGYVPDQHLVYFRMARIGLHAFNAASAYCLGAVGLGDGDDLPIAGFQPETESAAFVRVQLKFGVG